MYFISQNIRSATPFRIPHDKEVLLHTHQHLLGLDECLQHHLLIVQVDEGLLVHFQAPQHQKQVREVVTDDEHGLVHHLQHLPLHLDDGKGPELLNDGETESSTLRN